MINLQRCLTFYFFTKKAPQGMKRNLNRTVDNWLSNSIAKSPVQLQAMFVLAWFHSVVQVIFRNFLFSSLLSSTFPFA